MKSKGRWNAFILLVLTILLSSWGSVGHQKISLNISSSFSAEMEQFHDWVVFLSEHASDADYRKNDDPTEGWKHYIDIDNYPEFLSNGRIPQTVDSVELNHGDGFVEEQGSLPWATLNTYSALVQAFTVKDMEKAKLLAADLGHYVADGHMPMHITRNYDGQFTGNTGIHSRYESTMVNAYQDQIVYDGSPVEDIEDVGQYIFDYIYNNYCYVDSVILADNFAKGSAGSSSGALYLSLLWEKTDQFTIELFKNASHALANLIYNAWREAGKPSLDDSVQTFKGPVVTLSEEALYQPEFVGITSTALGIIYLVPENTPSELGFIREACIDSANVLPPFIVNFPLFGLENGLYWFYARDVKGELSLPVTFTITGVGIENSIRNEVILFPNPFNDFVRLSYTLQKQQYIKLQILDSSGKLIIQLKEGEEEAGRQVYNWDAGSVAQGVYYLVLEQDGASSIVQGIKY